MLGDGGMMNNAYVSAYEGCVFDDVTVVRLLVCTGVCVSVCVGGMFEYVSCANFHGEIVEWTGFAVAAWSLPAAVFALMTVCNLVPRALHHHRSTTTSHSSPHSTSIARHVARPHPVLALDINMPRTADDEI